MPQNKRAEDRLYNAFAITRRWPGVLTLEYHTIQSAALQALFSAFAKNSYRIVPKRQTLTPFPLHHGILSRSTTVCFSAVRPVRSGMPAPSSANSGTISRKGVKSSR